MPTPSDRVKRLAGSERSQRPLASPRAPCAWISGSPISRRPCTSRRRPSRPCATTAPTTAAPTASRPCARPSAPSLKRDYGVERSPENVLITSGGIEAIHVVSATYLNPGDEALIPDPEYSAYADSVALFGGTPVFVPLTPDFHFDFELLEKRISTRTRLMFVSSPGNPTGRVLRVDEIRRLAELAVKHDFLLVLDEAYHRLVYGGVDFLSICQVEEVRSRAILLNSFSKTYAMTGWRVGYMVADAALVKDMVTFHKAITICPNVPAQLACAAAAAGPQDCVESMRQEYERRKVLVEARLADIPGLVTPPCDGAFYVFPRFAHRLTSPQMTDHLFGKGILVRSGTEFGAGGQGHFRIAFCKSIETLEEGMTRLKDALGALS